MKTHIASHVLPKNKHITYCFLLSTYTTIISTECHPCLSPAPPEWTVTNFSVGPSQDDSSSYALTLTPLMIACWSKWTPSNVTPMINLTHWLQRFVWLVLRCIDTVQYNWTELNIIIDIWQSYWFSMIYLFIDRILMAMAGRKNMKGWRIIQKDFRFIESNTIDLCKMKMCVCVLACVLACVRVSGWLWWWNWSSDVALVTSWEPGHSDYHLSPCCELFITTWPPHGTLSDF